MAEHSNATAGYDQRPEASRCRPEEKVPLLRAYLKKWSFEVGAFLGDSCSFGGDSELLGGLLACGIGAGRRDLAAATPRRGIWMIDAGTRPVGRRNRSPSDRR